MSARWKSVCIVAVCAAWGTAGLAQAPPVTVLEVDAENIVLYNTDVFDASKFAADPNVTVPAAVRNFGFTVLIGDIVAVNGRPAKGTSIVHTRTINLSDNPNPGQAVADLVRTAGSQYYLDILQADGVPVGSIYVLGLSGGSPPPGAPLAVTASNNAVVGGTGAFLGARGQLGGAVVPGVLSFRTASVTEDPANRRRNGGGKLRFVVHLIPMSRPEIATTADGPLVVHSSDFSRVTGAKPARPGEILSLIATGLGPTRPGVDPGKPFPASPLAMVNSPVEVMVDGKPVEVLGAAGYPDTADRYQVNFRLPADATRGQVAIQLSAAWIVGPEVKIAVQ
ncbi:MAG: hypothetical protein HY235_08200 [Acidobacteria bacterium]|nr:hypothetical protein [Acidobacteriota bacterium]